jgi:hypothetical protein
MPALVGHLDLDGGGVRVALERAVADDELSDI